jgi:rhodanese-related sulfurtransferase
MKKGLNRLFCLLMLLVGSFIGVTVRANNLNNAVDDMLKGSIPVIHTAELDTQLAENDELVLLDAREKAEYEVSHLLGAQWIGYDDFSLKSVADINKDKTIVVYCSIGVRSERIAEKLKLNGFKTVLNLYGGIFAWANEGRILLDKNQLPTQSVHGYNKKWAQLLEAHVHSPQAQ